MRRRLFLAGLGGYMAASRLHAAQMVVGMTQFGQMQRSYVSRPQLIQQQCPQWCWAASASMIFASRGYSIDQKRIVAQVYNGLVCLPSGASPLGPTGTISGVLSAPWTDDNGLSFQPRIVAGYDYFSNFIGIDNTFIVRELQADRPILYCNRHHAMVVVSVDYLDTPMGPNVQMVGVLDPWPGSLGYHPLNALEMLGAHMGGDMTYLASIDI